jgi:CHAT domain-containing protein/tetratricopeptide (TPR) repeat protein
LDSHLNAEQIEELLRSAHGNEDRSLEERARDERLSGHLQGCTQCQSRLIEERVAMDRLARIAASGDAPPGPQCPSDDAWMEIAAGVFDVDSDNYVSHAAHCDHCSPLLHQAIADTADDLTPEEEAEIAGLPSSRPAWQHKFAAVLRESKIQSTPTLRRTRLLSWAVFGALAASILVTVAFVVRGRWSPSPERLLAQAYSEDRTLELRIPGGDASPLRTERGANRSLMEQDPTLLQAEALIGRKLRAHPGDPHWLQLQARADLLTWNYEPAITSLTEAEAINPDSASLLTDLSTAYFESAEVTRNHDDYAKSIELLGKVLDQNPNDEIALFNRALVLERLYLNAQALDDWNRYLKQFPTGKWAREAATHRLDVLQQVEGRQKSDLEPLLEPRAFIAAAREADFPQRIDNHIESYLDIALQRWLSTAYSSETGRNSLEARSDARTALEILSVETGRLHKDEFLRDLLADPARRTKSSPVAALSIAITDNHSGRNDQAIQKARQSEVDFRRIGNEAGILRAVFEQAYGEQRTLNSPDCLKDAVRAAGMAHNLRYTWLEAQSLIEEAFCNNIDGRVGLAALESRTAAQIARDAGYHDTFLRASIGEAATEWEGGSLPRAWSLIMSGEREYWSGRGAKARGIAFYKVMDAIAEFESQNYLQSSIIRDYLPSIDPNQDPVESVMTWYRLANSELMIGHDEAAAQAFRRAESILASAPAGTATEDRRILGIIGLAKVELKRGNLSAAQQLLESVRGQIPEVHESLAVMDFYETEGALANSSHNTLEASRAYESAISVSERALSTLNNAQDRLTWARTFTPAYRGLVGLRLDAGDSRGALVFWEWYHSLSLRTPEMSNPEAHKTATTLAGIKFSMGTQITTDFDAIKTRAPRNSVVYAQLTGRTVAWVNGVNGWSAKWIPANSTELNRLIELFVVECADPESDEALVRRHGQLLYRWLISPIEGSLVSDLPVTVEPDGEIERLPFGALVDSAGRYFDQDHAIVMSPGLIYGLAGHTPRRLSKKSAVSILKGAGADSELGLLPDSASAEEASDVSALFPGSTTFESTSARSRAFRHALANADIFHYSGHAERTSSNSGLVVDEAGPETGSPLLEASDFYSLSLGRCQLAVLAGCSTSLGSADRWIDRNGMIIPFVNAGVNCVVASLWQADSTATRTLMRSFYEGVLAGIPVGNALRRARQQVRSELRTDHPYYWASFEAFGPCTNGT